MSPRAVPSPCAICFTIPCLLAMKIARTYFKDSASIDFSRVISIIIIQNLYSVNGLHSALDFKGRQYSYNTIQ